MGFGDPSKLRYAAALAAALAHLLAGQQDAVGLAVLCDGAVAREPPSMGSTHARQLIDLLEALSAEGKTRLGPALHELAGSLRRKGVVLLFSDLHDETASVLEGIRRLRFDGHEVDVFHVLDPAELRLAWDDALELEDLETGERMEIQAPAVRDEYEARVRAWTDELRAGCDGCGADYLRVETNVAFAVTLAEWLRTRRLRRSR
jgi:uncharacterized protein (DUF58 family)